MVFHAFPRGVFIFSASKQRFFPENSSPTLSTNFEDPICASYRFKFKPFHWSGSNRWSFGHENPWKCEDLELASLKSLARRCGKCATAGRLEDEKGNVTEVRCDKWNVSRVTSWCERKGAIWSWGYLKSLHNRELRSYPQVSKYIWGQYSYLNCFKHTLEWPYFEGSLAFEKTILFGIPSLNFYGVSIQCENNGGNGDWWIWVLMKNGSCCEVFDIRTWYIYVYIYTHIYYTHVIYEYIHIYSYMYIYNTYIDYIFCIVYI